ncbi:hypothetical protein H5410_057817 [Solanum commersonii]|uniref:Uncharacterized protein n=1 Tax=Solanum commersonii TaxID=4109 RepID=A0A9J5WNX6_SOLCO|nr:hypothetical protein H5410_057817 [Solanum commersonii]
MEPAGLDFSCRRLPNGWEVIRVTEFLKILDNYKGLSTPTMALAIETYLDFEGPFQSNCVLPCSRANETNNHLFLYYQCLEILWKCWYAGKLAAHQVGRSGRVSSRHRHVYGEQRGWKGTPDVLKTQQILNRRFK